MQNKTSESHYISLEDKEKLTRFLLTELALDLRNYSEASVRRRFTKIINDFNLKNVENLIVMLRNRPDARELFINHFTVNVTEMFRDPEFYQSLVSSIGIHFREQREIRIWSVGCSTGEEIISLAILLHEEGMLHKCYILGTDLNTEVLQMARQAVYSYRHMAEYEKSYSLAGGKKQLQNYYTTFAENAHFEKSLLQNVEYRAGNIMESSRDQFDLILCRNVLIYFNSVLQNKVLQTMSRSLKDGGVLALGSKESLIFFDDKKDFVELDAENKIFQKLG